MAKAEIIEHDAGAMVPRSTNAVTPMDMIDRALSSGSSPETISRLMDLQERWEKNQARKDFDTAIAAAKSEIKPIGRDATGHNSKKYVSLDAIAKAVDPILSKHGLAYRFKTTQTDRINVACILFGHGHAEESSLSGPPDKTGSKNDIQAIGSTLTYLQRYTLVQALGLAASDDDDGGAGGKRDTQTITDAQDDEIKALIKARSNPPAALEKFLSIFKVESTSDLLAADFERAKAALQRPAKKPEVVS